MKLQLCIKRQESHKVQFKWKTRGPFIIREIKKSFLEEESFKLKVTRQRGYREEDPI